MKKIHISQQSIVFVLFVLMFLGFALLLPGFAQVDNLLTLLQNVAILGILGLGMSVVVIGRGIDISMIAALAVPSGLLLQLMQNGMSLPAACALAVGLSLAFGLVNGWLIAYAEVPSLFTTLASGLFLAGLGQAFFFQLEVVQWPSNMDSIAWMGRGTFAGLPMPVVMFGIAAAGLALFLKRLRAGAFIYAIGDNPFGARATGLPTRPIVVLQYVMAALIGVFAGIVMAASVNSMPTRIFNSTMIYDVVLVVVLGGIGLSGGRGGVLNVIIGTLLIGTMLNGMTILDISYSVQNIVKGVVLLVAILVDSAFNPRNEETAQQGDI
ncbi:MULTISPECIES: ABC transporter permease [unclassified Variovorax]|jgi:ribose transport system permease protein|uniref:ABC transporter permease n=1 Tax=unclassified Variovorax TaxID=663243 RepID=UPI002B23D454|nr:MULTISPECIES: ABC transporter permease [unclassified Variovorax]MEB0055833.1 ABC transporter permease [Variovorax sp. LG9.2]MEB0112731.1 ABC transporter permease [Variovorax sp. RTB1]